MGIETVIVKSCYNISKQISSHPDMLFHHLGNNNMLYHVGSDIEAYQKLKKMGFNMIPIEKPLGNHYPYDVALNCARIGQFLFCNKKTAANEINLFCEQDNIHISNVKQGYSKCSVCIVSKNAIITSDKSIAVAASKVGIEVLMIKEGFIGLSGYNYGFIGGCCGKLGKNIMAFCGDISKHPDYESIRRFLFDRGVSIKILDSNTCLKDIGSIIPLIEADN